MQDPITLKSGSTLEIGIAPFATGNRLLKVIAAELARVEVNIDLSSLKDFGAKDVNTLKNVILQMLASDLVEAAAMECAKKCLYNGQGIIVGTFELEAARQDYLPTMVEVIKANLRPFFSGLDWSSLISGKPLSSDPKPE